MAFPTAVSSLVNAAADTSLPGSIADVTYHITSLATAWPLVLSVASALVPTIGTVYATPAHNQDFDPAEETTDQGTDHHSRSYHRGGKNQYHKV